jgi:high-affinity Fe2+/Pb2+ permease
MYEKFRWVLAPAVFIFIGLIMKLSNNKKQFGLILEYKKYWLVLIIVGFFLFLLKLYTRLS